MSCDLYLALLPLLPSRLLAGLLLLLEDGVQGEVSSPSLLLLSLHQQQLQLALWTIRSCPVQEDENGHHHLLLLILLSFPLPITFLPCGCHGNIIFEERIIKPEIIVM